MPVDAFLVFVPGDADPKIAIEGESTDIVGQGAKAIEIIDFKWGATSVLKEKKKGLHENTNHEQKGNLFKQVARSDLGMRKIEVKSFSITKPIDTASLALFQACTTKDCKFSLAKVLFRKLSSEGVPYVYLSFEFHEVRIDKIEWKIVSLDSSTDKPSEEDVDFSFNKCTLYYIPQSSKGQKMKEVKQTAEFSRPVNKPSESK